MSKYLIVEYKVRPEKLEECLEAIEAFKAAVDATEPDVLRYDPVQKPDKVSFIHYIEFRDEIAEAAHKDAPHTTKFVEVLYPNCEQAPVFTEVTYIDAGDEAAAVPDELAGAKGGQE